MGCAVFYADNYRKILGFFCACFSGRKSSCSSSLQKTMVAKGKCRCGCLLCLQITTRYRLIISPEEHQKNKPPNHRGLYLLPKYLFEEAHRIYCRSVNSHLKVKMLTGRPTGRSDIAKALSLRDGLTCLNLAF